MIAQRRLAISAVIVSGLVLSGCAQPNDPAADGPVTITWWDNQQTDSGLSELQQAAVDKFEKAYPDIKVEVQTIPYDQYQQKLQLAVQGGDSPDVATVDQIWTAGLAAGGSIIPLGDLLSQSKTIKEDNFFSGAWASAVVDDKVYGIPFNVDVWQFTYYNRAVFEAAGIDPQSIVTWDGLKAAGQALTKDGQFGIGLFGAGGEAATVVMDSFIYSNGGEVLDSEGSCALNEAPAVEALAYMASLAPYAPEGILNNGPGEIQKLFVNGTSATEWWPSLEQGGLKSSSIDWGFVAGTAPEGKTPVGTYGGWNLSVFADADEAHRKAAFTFIEFLTDPKINGTVVDLLPANLEAAEAYVRANREDPDTVLEHLNNAKARPLSENYLEVSKIQQDMWQRILNGGDAQNETDAACKSIDALSN